MIRSPAIVALRKKYGKYLPHQRANVDFIIYYEVDDDNSKHALSLAAFGEDKDWVLLEKA